MVQNNIVGEQALYNVGHILFNHPDNIHLKRERIKFDLAILGIFKAYNYYL